MPLPTTKSELLTSLTKAYQKLDAEFDAVSTALERESGIEGEISCCDLIAYQLGWGRLLLGWEQAEKGGNTPDMPAKGYKWNQLGELAQTFYAAQQDKSLAKLRQEYAGLVAELTTWIESIPEKELFAVGVRQWAGEKWPLVKWIQVNTIAPYSSARTKLRRWKKQHNL